MDTRIIRIFNTYGPRMAIGDGRVISNFIVQALRGQKLTIYGDGDQTRCFCYVDDLVEGIIALMKYEGEGAAEPVNVGSSDERSMNDLVECLGEVMGRKLEAEYLPLPGDDPVRRRPDPTRARERLGWEPRVSLNDGLSRTVEYFRGQLAE